MPDSNIENLTLSTISSLDEVPIRRLTENYKLNLSGSITGVIGMNNLSLFGTTTSSQLNNIISDNSGVGPLIFANSPTLTNVTISDSLSLGTAGSFNGTLTFKNTSSGSISVVTASGPLGTKTLTLPAVNGTILTDQDVSYGGNGNADDGKVAAYDDGGDLWATDVYLGDALATHGTNRPGHLVLHDSSGNTTTIQTTSTTDGSITLTLPSSGTRIYGSADGSTGGNGGLDVDKIAIYDSAGGLRGEVLTADLNIEIGRDGNTPQILLNEPLSGEQLTISTATLSASRTINFPDDDGTVLLDNGLYDAIDSNNASENRIYRPETYGAVRNGSTNDRAAIQSAIDACYTAGGGIVQLSAGTYRVQESSGLAIMLKTGVKLKGMGMSVTTISTDNATASNTYCLIAPYGYNTATSPYSAHELDIEDLTVTGTQYTSSTPNNNLHDLIGIAHCPKARITRVGFDTARYHFAEINCSKNVIFTDCATVGNGNHGVLGCKFQLDNGGSCGQISTNARYSTSITNSATYASGTQTLLTVSSTSNFQVGDFVTITSANGASASTYNRVGGFKITNIVSSTTMAISVAWPGNATTTGTIKAEIPIDGVTWIRYQDKAASDTSFDQARDFLELSHTNYYNIIRNVTVQDSTIIPVTFSSTVPSTRGIISFDSGAYPLEFTNFKFINNVIRDGGHTGLTILLNMYLAYDANYPYRRMSNIEISNNRVLNCGLIHFLLIGQSDDDVGARTSVTTNITQVTDKVFVKNNLVEVVLKGSAATAARPTRLFRIGSMNSAVVEGNRVYVPDLAPSNLYGLSWTLSVSQNYAFFFDHVRNLTAKDNTVESYLTVGNAYMYLHGFVFAVGAFETAGIESYQTWINNNVLGFGSIDDNISHTFIELGNSSIQYSTWLNPRNLYCKGVWSGNRGSSGGTRPGDTWSIYSDNHNTPCQVITSSPTTSGNANVYGRHDWWDGIPVYQTINNTATTIDPLTTHLVQTGTMSASRVVTMPYANLGRNFYLLDQSGTVTGANVLVPTRVGNDLINGSTVQTGSGAYFKMSFISNKVSGWMAGL